eukprot:403340035
MQVNPQRGLLQILNINRLIIYRQLVANFLNVLQKRTLMSKIPLNKVSHIYEQSPRNHGGTSGSEQKYSARSSNNNPSQAQSAIQTQRKNVIGGQTKGAHQLNFRRHQVMDITDDANTNSYNKLTTIHTDHDNRTTLEPINDASNHHSQPPPAYNLFYHQQTQDSSRYDSKKSLRVILKQPSIKELQSSFNKQQTEQPKLFQFTRKQNMIGESSVSSTREKFGAGSNQLFKIKKSSVANIPLPQTTEAQQIPQIGKRKPLIIRKNNFIQNSNAAYNQLQESQNTTQNMQTVISGVTNRFNNTNNMNQTSGQMSEASQSQTRYGITQMLKSLNSTTQSNDLANSLQQTNQSLKENKMFKINNSKKRLDTARKSRIQQIQQDTSAVNTSSILQQQQNSLSQQPIEQRKQNQPPILSFLTQKKRSLLIPKVKIDNISSQVANQFAPNLQQNSSHLKTSSRDTSNRNTVTTQANTNTKMISVQSNQTTVNQQILNITYSQGYSTNPQILTDQAASLNFNLTANIQQIQNNIQTPQNQASLQPTLLQDKFEQPQKFVKRGQILRIQKQKQEQQNSMNATIEFKDRDSSQNNDKFQIQTQMNSTAPIMNQNQLNRNESKKDLASVDENKKHGNQKSQHFVQEDLIIHENINDSSCTPKNFSVLNKSNIQQEISKNEISQLQKAETLLVETINNEETIQNEENKQKQNQKGSSIIQSKEIPQNQDLKSSYISQSSNTPQKVVATTQPIKLSSKTQVNHNEEQSSSNHQAQKSETKPTVKQRHYNISQNTVKSPIGTSISFKSQNSQQAGPNHDEIIKFPMKPSKALKLFMKQLTDYEMGEILDYPEVYFMGIGASKVHGSPKNEHNYGYDDEKGDYKIVVGDHIGYRFEVLEFIGKGSFGTALKCFDHKKKEDVALKIVKNKKKYQYQAGIELKILNFLKENDQDDIMNVVHMKDYVIFRKHLCISFELLSMNLFEFLKINDFNGFDHNLIRRFAIQLLYALKYLKEFQIIHCDLKPENILLKEPNKSGIKIIDFGSAPEIMLGIPYTCAIDMWSFGCIMAELYIGYPIFPGESENDQMSRIIEMCNIPSREVYEISQRRQKFFNETSTGDYEPIMLPNSRGKLRKPAGKPLSLLIGDEDPEFLDFVEKCLDWNPETRMTPDDALRHIWVLKGLPPQVLIHHQRMHNITTPELPEAVKDARDKFFLEQTISQENNSQINKERGQQQQSSHQKSSQNSNTKNRNTSQKTETIKSLERAQLKNQLHQLNQNKQNQNHFNQPRGNALVIHNKLNHPGGADSHSNDNSLTRPGIGAANSLNFQTINHKDENTANNQGVKRRVQGRQYVSVKQQSKGYQ